MAIILFTLIVQYWCDFLEVQYIIIIIHYCLFIAITNPTFVGARRNFSTGAA